MYDTNFWNKFNEDDEANYNEEFSKFIRDLASSLRANNVLEVGCNTGNDLRAFSEDFEVHGIDLNENAIEKAKKKLSSFKFQKASIVEIPFSDSTFDFVFTHNVLNYISDDEMPKAVNELFRVSNKYILNCELYDENENSMNDNEINAKYRNMLNRWSNFKVKIISHVDMHEDIDPKKSRFTLVRKI